MADLISQTAFAATMGVDRSQVTMWKRAGMPMAAGGLVDPVQASAWVRRNVDPTQRQRHSIGAKVEAGAERRRQQESAEQLERLGIWFMTQKAPERVARAALAAGVPLDLAKALYTRLLTEMPDLANDAREMLGTPAGELGPFAELTHLPEPNWAAMVTATAEPVRRTNSPSARRK